jgi:hypothetical protein
MRLSELKEVVLLWGLPSRQGITQIKKKVQVDKEVYVLVPEMRPYLLGLKIAKIFTVENIRHVYATDNMMGVLFYQRKVKEVLFFYKELADHHVVGICGSLYACLLAYLHNVPIRLLQGDTMTRVAQEASLLDEHIRLQYNDVFKSADDEAVPMDIIQ